MLRLVLATLMGSALLAAHESARASTYVAFDVSPAFRTGSYRWRGPSGLPQLDPRPVDIRTSFSGAGALTHLAVGAALDPRFALAGELGVGLLLGESGMPHSGPSGMLLARLGLRAEALLTEHAFVRGALGYEVMALPGGGADIGARENVWNHETTSGPWASLAGGLRGRRVGGVARVDVGRATSTHAVYWPITFSLGLDVTWR